MKKIPLFTLLLCAHFLYAEEAKVYYPAQSSPAALTSTEGATRAEPGPKTNPVATSILYLVFLGAMGYVAYTLWQKRTHPQATQKLSAQNLQILTTRPLGNRQFLVVVKYNQEELLLGVGQGFITRLNNSNKDVCPCKD